MDNCCCYCPLGVMQLHLTEMCMKDYHADYTHSLNSRTTITICCVMKILVYSCYCTVANKLTIIPIV